MGFWICRTHTTTRKHTLGTHTRHTPTQPSTGRQAGSTRTPIGRHTHGRLAACQRSRCWVPRLLPFHTRTRGYCLPPPPPLLIKHRMGVVENTAVAFGIPSARAMLWIHLNPSRINTTLQLLAQASSSYRILLALVPTYPPAPPAVPFFCLHCTFQATRAKPRPHATPTKQRKARGETNTWSYLT